VAPEMRLVFTQKSAEFTPSYGTPQFFGGGGEAPKIWDRQSLSAHTSNYMWKFQGDQQRHLGDTAPQSGREKKRKKLSKI